MMLRGCHILCTFISIYQSINNLRPHGHTVLGILICYMYLHIACMCTFTPIPRFGGIINNIPKNHPIYQNPFHSHTIILNKVPPRIPQMLRDPGKSSCGSAIALPPSTDRFQKVQNLPIYGRLSVREDFTLLQK
ncbi:hypothetical protein K445DRAFT_229558 [Daldinia sp. EC12]|nr:hypothetical protein K445DRAFT_229558 [Daldinia sp. EC12]